MSDCLFCKIARKEIPATWVYEDDDMLAFNDIHPRAPVHLLLIPRKHLAGLHQLEDQDASLLAKMMLTLPRLAQQQGLSEGFRTVINTGPGGGQEVYHLHMHLIGDIRHAQRSTLF